MAVVTTVVQVCALGESFCFLDVVCFLKLLDLAQELCWVQMCVLWLLLETPASCCADAW
jgi:hypothetical protein